MQYEVLKVLKIPETQLLHPEDGTVRNTNRTSVCGSTCKPFNPVQNWLFPSTTSDGPHSLISAVLQYFFVLSDVVVRLGSNSPEFDK